MFPGSLPVDELASEDAHLGPFPHDITCELVDIPASVNVCQVVFKSANTHDSVGLRVEPAHSCDHIFGLLERVLQIGLDSVLR